MPGPDGDAVDVGTNWLPRMADLVDGGAEPMDVDAGESKILQTTSADQEMRDGDDENTADVTNTAIPPGCREALATALAVQADWRARWHTETTDGARGKLKMGLVGVPV